MSRTAAAATTSTSSRNRAMLMLAAVFGILAAVLMFAFLKGRGGSNENVLNEALKAGGASESVVVVARDIQPGEQITADMLTTKPIPVTALLSGRIKDVEEIEGKVATAPLFAGEQVIEAKVTTYAGQNTLAFKVPAGLRSLSLEVPHEAWIAGGLVQPGDRVDILGITVLAKTDPLTGEEKPNVVSGYLVQDAEVLAVSQKIVKSIPNLDLRVKNPQAAGTAGAAVAPVASPGDKTDSFEKAISVTLALTPEQAAKVALIDAMKDDAGQYRILVRQKGDTNKVTGTQAWTLDETIPDPKKK